MVDFIEQQRRQSINRQLDQTDVSQTDQRNIQDDQVDTDTDPQDTTRRNIFDKKQRQDILSGGFLSESQESRLRSASERFTGGVETVAQGAGELARQTPIVRGVSLADRVTQTDLSPAVTAGEKFTEGAVKGAGQLANVPAFIQSAETITEIAQSTPKLAKNPQATAATAGLVGSAVFREGKEAVTERPSETAGQVLGNVVGGAAVSPFKISRLKVPKLQGKDTSVTGVDVATPPAISALRSTPRSRKTLVGFEGKKPTLGTPSIQNLKDVDVERLGGSKANQGPVFEPIRGFDTGVVTKSVIEQGDPKDVARIQAGTDLLDDAETITGVRSGDITEQDVIETIGSARDVESDPEDVAAGLRDADATIFGSGAVAAQASDEFRTPGDIDIVVPDKTKAGKAIAAETGLSKEQAVSRFDIKEADDFAGLERGEQFGFGRFSRSPIQAGGIGINPIGEELQRKAGASLFLRGSDIGGEGLDIGPRPIPADQSIIRRKDPVDALTIGQELDAASTQRFKEAFDITDQELQDRGFNIDSDNGLANADISDSTDIDFDQASSIIGTQQSPISAGDVASASSPITAARGISPTVQSPSVSPTVESPTTSPSVSPTVQSPSPSFAPSISPSISPQSPSVSPTVDSPSISPIPSSTPSQPPSVTSAPPSFIPTSITPTTPPSVSPPTTSTPPSTTTTPPTSTTPPTTQDTPTPPPTSRVPTPNFDLDPESDDEDDELVEFGFLRQQFTQDILDPSEIFGSNDNSNNNNNDDLPVDDPFGFNF